MSERLQELRALAPVLNQLSADPHARVHYELMSDALIWSDELPPDQECPCLRGVFRYRTTLMLGKPEEKYREGWEILQRLCPRWPGFLPSRRESDASKLQHYEDSRARLLSEWEAVDANYAREQREIAAR